MDNSTEILEKLLQTARLQGATAADAALIRATDLNASCRLGNPEGLERSESSGIGLRAWVGESQASASSTDFSAAALTELAERVVAMAKLAPADANSTLAPKDRLAKNPPALDLFDAEEPTAAWLSENCKACEDAARSVTGITNSEGADASYSASEITLATSDGFLGHTQSSMFSLSVSVLAGAGSGMERDYAYSAKRFRHDLKSPASIGAEAAERALKRINPKKVATQQVPVVFDPRVSKSLVGYLASAINGAAIARGTSFLKDAMGSQLFAPGIHIIDDPHMLRGLGSRSFDGEGVANKKMALVENGVLKTWLLDQRSANQLKLQTTGHAARGLASPPHPSPSNLFLQPGSISKDALISDIKQGFYVTETFGMGVNLITGDYSQGASGFWIENGQIAYPVSEVTIAGNLRSMFSQLTPANDLEFTYSINAPTLRVEGMTVAGT